MKVNSQMSEIFTHYFIEETQKLRRVVFGELRRNVNCGGGQPNRKTDGPSIANKFLPGLSLFKMLPISEDTCGGYTKNSHRRVFPSFLLRSISLHRSRPATLEGPRACRPRSANHLQDRPAAHWLKYSFGQSQTGLCTSGYFNRLLRVFRQEWSQKFVGVAGHCWS